MYGDCLYVCVPTLSTSTCSMHSYEYGGGMILRELVTGNVEKKVGSGQVCAVEGQINP